VESSIIPPERTEVYYGEEEAMKILLQAMANVKKEAVVCSDANSPAFSMGVEPVKKGFIDFKKRGVKIRQIVEITKDNLEYCKEFMNYVELRHMDTVKGNMAVSETEYVATAVLEGAVPVTQTLYSNVKAFLEQQRYFFENLWSKAIPAEQRIRDIEEGRESINLEVLSSNRESGARGWRMVENSKEEILILFPTVNVFSAAINAGAMNAYNNAAKRGVTVQILTGVGSNDTPSIVEEAQKKPLPSIQIRTFREEEKEGEGIMMAILVVDNQEVITWNIANESTNDIYQMAGMAIYSSNSSVVSSYRSIFNSLWKQVELYEQIKAQEQLQKEFINIAAHELRTPIQPILGMADLLDSQFSEGKKEKGELTRDELAILVRNAKRLERLSSDILEIARIESGILNLNIQEFNLNDVITPLVQDARNEINSNGKDVKIHYLLQT
jgi:hypothetical protein